MKNKKYWLITSALTLLPILLGLLLWDRLPDQLPTHFGINGTADGFSGKGFAVFGIPLMMLAFHVLIFAATRLDKQNRGHNEKVLKLTGLIFPAMSIFFALLIYNHGMGLERNPSSLLLPLLGVFFILIGNWLPKIKQNSTLGIKIKWTIYNEENWNKTHRFAGFIWVIGGLLLCILGLLPGAAFVPALVGTLLLMVLLPTLYSCRLANRQRREGTWTESEVSKGMKQHPAVKIISLVLVAALLVVLGVVMFTGSIDYTCTEDALVIEADFWDDSTVPYVEIDAIEFRGSAPEGSREWGFASARLMMGWFDNDEFGGHTRYSYVGAEAYIVVTCGDDTLILNAENEEATMALYEELSARIG